MTDKFGENYQFDKVQICESFGKDQDSIMERLKSLVVSSDEAVLVFGHMIHNKLICLENVESSINFIRSMTSQMSPEMEESSILATICPKSENELKSEEDLSNVVSSRVIQNITVTKKEKKKNQLLETCRFRHIAIRFAYDGSSYSGFAENVGSPNDMSVEKDFFAALTKTCLIQNVESQKRSAHCQYSRCGRTDRGVSAFGQVVGIKVRSKIPIMDANGEVIADDRLPRNSFQPIKFSGLSKENGTKRKRKRNNGKAENDTDQIEMKELDYCKILNGVLPETIQCLGWSPVSEEFSARFSAKDRTYRYFFVRRSLDLSAMQQALDLMVGSHDFRNLCKMDTEAVSNFVRVIKYAKIVSPTKPTDRCVCYFEICGQAFLWHMIRCIVSVCFMVGKGLEDPSVVTELLNVEKHPGKPSYSMAADLPLVLHSCSFNNVTFGYSSPSLWEVHNTLESQWEQAALKAERLYNAIKSLQSEAYVDLEEFGDFVRNHLAPFVMGGGKRSRKSHALDSAVLDAIQKASDENIVKIVKTMRKCSRDSFVEVNELHPSLENNPCESKFMMSWDEALKVIQELDLYRLVTPKLKESLFHVKLFERNTGTTYEEKVAAMKGKRKERYEENMQKQMTPEMDLEFYAKMAQQGGSGV